MGYQDVKFEAQKGQLGHGDTTQRNVPTEVAGLAGEVIVAGRFSPGMLQTCGTCWSTRTMNLITARIAAQVLAENSILLWSQRAAILTHLVVMLR